MISFLSNYNQVFIDNLDGSKYQILDIINKNSSEMILNDIDINKIIQNNIFHIFSCFKYKIIGEYKYVYSKNYINNIVSEILKNSQNINDLFKDYILKYINEKKNIIKDLFYNKNKNFQYDGDFISSLFYSLKKDIINFSLKLIFYFEKNQILFTKLIKKEFYLKFKEIQNYIDELIKDFPNQIKEINIIDRIQANNVGIVILNINIPCIKKNLEILIKYIKEEILEDYLNNDQLLIKLRNEQNKNIYKI